MWESLSILQHCDKIKSAEIFSDLIEILVKPSLVAKLF